MPTPPDPPTGPHDLAVGLRGVVRATLEDLVHRLAPGFDLPRTLAGHPVGADVAADLAFTLGLLADSGATEVAGVPVEEAVVRALARVDGAGTHTFWSYRVAETLARRGPFEDNPLLAGLDDGRRRELAEACDSSGWVALLDQGLPRNYAAVLARCELARHRLGLLDADGEAGLDRLVDRARTVLDTGTGLLDDSTHGTGRYDIYSADVWLFTEPLADRLGDLWPAGARAALALVDAVAHHDGAAVTWGRSTGVLAAALTVELGALAVGAGLTDRPDVWLGRAARATDDVARWFDGGLVTAHLHRSPYRYRGPARRLQLTLDVLGKLAWAAGRLLDAPGPGPAPGSACWPEHDRLVRFETGRAVGAWTVRRAGLDLVVPFTGATRSDYLAAPRSPGLFEVPVDADQPCWVPLVLAGGQRWTVGGLPTRLAHDGGAVRATWDGLVPSGDLDPPASPDRDRLPVRAEVAYRLRGRTLEMALDLDLGDDPGAPGAAGATLPAGAAEATPPDAVTVLVPETATRPLSVTCTDTIAGEARRVDRVAVDGMAEWQTFWSSLAAVHQIDLAPVRSHHVAVRVTPVLRVASTNAGHHYHDSLYGPLTGRVRATLPPLGPFADRTVRLDDVDLFHLHWPEWFAFDDVDAHRQAIAALAERGIPVVWTAHNLTPHSKQPEVYDPIYQLWADAADAVIHHSAWGESLVRRRYRFRPACRHQVIPHGHFGELWAEVASLSRAEVEAELGLPPCRWRIGVVGAPRAEKHVVEFLRGVAASGRHDLQVACWSLRPGEEAPDDPRIAVAEVYDMVDAATYARRLAVCDLLALPFDPDGEMLATGTAADALGLGLPALVSDWPYLAEVLGPAGIRCGHTAESVASTLDRLTDDQVRRAAAACRQRRDEQSWPALAEQTLALFEDVLATTARY